MESEQDVHGLDEAISRRQAAVAQRRRSVAAASALQDSDYDSEEEDVDEMECAQTLAYGVEGEAEVVGAGELSELDRAISRRQAADAQRRRSVVLASALADSDFDSEEEDVGDELDTTKSAAYGVPAAEDAPTTAAGAGKA